MHCYLGYIRWFHSTYMTKIISIFFLLSAEKWGMSLFFDAAVCCLLCLAKISVTFFVDWLGKYLVYWWCVLSLSMIQHRRGELARCYFWIFWPLCWCWLRLNILTFVLDLIDVEYSDLCVGADWGWIFWPLCWCWLMLNILTFVLDLIDVEYSDLCVGSDWCWIFWLLCWCWLMLNILTFVLDLIDVE
jgi:hypothetical protein